MLQRNETQKNLICFSPSALAVAGGCHKIYYDPFSSSSSCQNNLQIVEVHHIQIKRFENQSADRRTLVIKHWKHLRFFHWWENGQMEKWTHACLQYLLCKAPKIKFALLQSTKELTADPHPRFDQKYFSTIVFELIVSCSNFGALQIFVSKRGRERFAYDKC